MAKICVVGTGYVGMIQSVGMAKLGFNVIAVDIDENKVDKINNKIPPIYEKGLKKLLEKLVPSKMSATTDLKKAVMESDVTFVCVGTPSKKQGSMSMYQLEVVSKEIGKILKNKNKYHVIVVKSTVIPGTSENIVVKTIEKKSGKKCPKDFGIVMNPEFLKEGTAIDDFFEPDRIVLGSNDSKALKIIKKLYSSFKCPVLETSLKEAEMIKYVSNAFLATKISFINEIGNICKKFDINSNLIAKGIGLDRRISPKFLKSGIGFGGSCFPKDVNALVYKATELGYNPRLLRSVLDVNREQPLKLLELLEKLGKLRGKKIGILGLTFKSGTDDIRESPALSTIKELLMEEADLNIYDPKAMPQVKKIFPHLNYLKNGQQVIEDSEIVLILTEWPEFKKLNYGDKLVIDGKNVFDNGNVPKNYEGVCW
ncbi:UDP-glucose/GDP-mannose dehydrogenase family protein [archaeon]|jgi:UDPglucose 6-dehydrogenase|nr:UDP-glucose/GDP-mannose dehydrogenase family protein [Candidatus Woesearchaeota archaeon]MBT4352814.1 UDP-glucose/GDP-mannose dehydrogenase family protein [archaeon]MBT6820939.1 UDP-glucose/GDP-mannose dehydrogenase family protein [archaeon]MBT7392131.1 UDP-glucose/GDP-mannose dehydrogenase family protein [archaeon]